MDEPVRESCESVTSRFLPVHIRWMVRRDMNEVYAIERACYGELSWESEDFIRCIRQRNSIAQVAESDGRVVGFMLYELHKVQLHVLNFCVDPLFRRCGVGSQMVKNLKSKLSLDRRLRIRVEVGEDHEGSHLFLRSHGFLATGVLRHFCVNDRDAYCFQFTKTGPHAAPC